MTHYPEYTEEITADNGDSIAQLALQSPQQFVSIRYKNFSECFNDNFLDCEFDKIKTAECILNLFLNNMVSNKNTSHTQKSQINPIFYNEINRSKTWENFTCTQIHARAHDGSSKACISYSLPRTV